MLGQKSTIRYILRYKMAKNIFFNFCLKNIKQFNIEIYVVYYYYENTLSGYFFTYFKMSGMG